MPKPIEQANINIASDDAESRSRSSDPECLMASD